MRRDSLNLYAFIYCLIEFRTNMICYVQERLSVVNAIRASDMRRVCIKRVTEFELKLHTLLHEDTGKADPANHCVSILELISDNDEEGLLYLVMPALSRLDFSSFIHVRDVVEFTTQVLLVGNDNQKQTHAIN